MPAMQFLSIFLYFFKNIKYVNPKIDIMKFGGWEQKSQIEFPYGLFF